MTRLQNTVQFCGVVDDEGIEVDDTCGLRGCTISNIDRTGERRDDERFVVILLSWHRSLSRALRSQP